MLANVINVVLVCLTFASIAVELMIALSSTTIELDRRHFDTHADARSWRFWRNLYSKNMIGQLAYLNDIQIIGHHLNQLPSFARHVYTVVERDALDGWNNCTNDNCVHRHWLAQSVFGKTQLSNLDQHKDQQCVANLYYGDKYQDNALRCNSGSRKLWTQFADCVSFAMRQTRMGQYLIGAVQLSAGDCIDIDDARQVIVKLARDDQESASQINEQIQSEKTNKTKALHDALSAMQDRHELIQNPLLERIGHQMD